jgi:uncharacterized protein YeaO (DUF488 family)
MAETPVRTKSVYEPADPNDGRRVLATRYWPRGIRKTAADEYVRKLGPSRDLLYAFKRGEIGWETFRARYFQEMEGEEAKSEIRRLADVARSERITVLCVCRDERECHRSLLRELILKSRET